MFNPYVDIDLEALAHNYAVVKRHAPHSKVLAMIKANAYGHGAVMCAKTLTEVDAFGIARLPEALELRHAGITKPLVLMGGIFHVSELDVIAAYDLDLVVHDFYQIEMLEQYKGPAQFSVWLKIDTGLSRLGFKDADIEQAYARLRRCAAVKQPFKVLSHLVAPEVENNPVTDLQLAMFTKHTAAWPEEKSLAKSAAIMTRPDTHFDWVRPGIMLYGISPFLDRTGADLGLKPVMTLKSRLVRIDRRHKGANIGYGAQTAAPEDMDVGIVAIGYADGYPRHIQAPAPVLVNQAQAYSIGRIAMDLMMIDLRTAPRATVGDEVTLWGVNAPIEHVARAANTIPYTLTTAIAARVQRHYLGSQEDELKWVKKL